jgi:hypothetical protein
MAADPQVVATVVKNLSGAQSVPAKVDCYRHPSQRGRVSPNMLFQIPVTVSPDWALIAIENGMLKGTEEGAGNAAVRTLPDLSVYHYHSVNLTSLVVCAELYIHAT